MLPNNCKILLYNKEVDMRKSIDGLSIIISESTERMLHQQDVNFIYNKMLPLMLAKSLKKQK
jgi:hypothetical protein